MTYDDVFWGRDFMVFIDLENAYDSIDNKYIVESSKDIIEWGKLLNAVNFLCSKNINVNMVKAFGLMSECVKYVLCHHGSLIYMDDVGREVQAKVMIWGVELVGV